ncbi:GntR family transcriptional regulator [Streptomyces justiciae]|uniref:GntR family transcriptional regulator n=1 Tax=Streptomyces justiciae TaxID=2780140 RepID=UPI0021199F3C|nr:GntR family transcriptional regulator [Streptomyces justiciae]MCW8378676.1 GntR family transcriptional regulator [Streptomyces justiciae]
MSSSGPWPDDRPQTRAEWVDARLRMAILTGRLEPGAKLHAERLASEWGVSATPVREAFQRLAGEGLVEIAPQRGARVAGLDHDKAAEYYELRLLLEPRALKSSLSEADEDFLDQVRRAAAELETAADLDAGFLAHRRFHQTLLSRCRNREMLRMCGILQDQTQRFAAHSIDLEHTNQHRALAAAVLAGDADEAVRLLAAHLGHTADAAHITTTV